jgi:BirA family biotin operon repressor/biotin-[acetyl-CoA-carboxylase] ligase
VSVVLAPGRARVDPARATMLLTMSAGVALAEAIQSVTGLDVDLKWPNDLYAGKRKLGGILAESSSAGAPLEWVVLGYGINISAAAYPPELADRATSLESEARRAVDRDQLFNASLASLDERYDDLLNGRFDAILDAWRRRSPSATGARVTWRTIDGACRGVTNGIDDSGALLVQTADGVERIVSGEMTWEL